MNRFKLYLLLPLACVSFAQVSHAQSRTYFNSIIAWQIHYKQEFLQNPQSPIPHSEVKQIQFFTPDSHYRIPAKLTPSSDQSPFSIKTEDGQSQEFIKYGTLTFQLNNQQLQLSLYRSVSLMQSSTYHNLLFLPFYDKTNGTLTYAGGRYLDIDLTDIRHNQVILDFNKAYNPYCAYTEGYSCPLPPPGNSLPIPIYAGELAFKRSL